MRDLREHSPGSVEKIVPGVLCTQFNNLDLQMVLGEGEGFDY